MKKTGILKTVDNHAIAYDHYINGKDKVIIIVHGFYNSKASELLISLAEHFLCDYDVFVFDLRGHGKSSGFFTWTSRENNDLEAVLYFLNDKYKKIGIIGFSMGGSISVNVLAKNKFKVDSFVSVSSPSNQDKIDYKWWQLDFENDILYSLLTPGGRRGKGVRPGWLWHKKEKPIDNVKYLKLPVLYIHGDKDWVIGKWHSEALYKGTFSYKKFFVINKGPHAEYLLRKCRNVFLSEVDKWFKDTMQNKEDVWESLRK